MNFFFWKELGVTRHEELILKNVELVRISEKLGKEIIKAGEWELYLSRHSG